MTNMKTNQQEAVSAAVSKKELRKIAWRWILGSQITWNYEKMMGIGYLWAMLPILKKFYKKPEELQEMMRVHAQFYNTNPIMGGLILGIDIAAEEKGGINAKEAVQGIKTGLMGPFAGIGDTIFSVLIPTIFGSIAAYMGQQGNITGVFIWLAVTIAILVSRTFFPEITYKEGVKWISSQKSQLDAITHAATILGLMVVGALITSVVKVNLALTFTAGDVTVVAQDVLNQIMPCLAPAGVVALVYAMLGNKKLNSTRVILIIMALSVVLYALGILA